MWVRARPRTQVRGCGCCLPIPLGVLVAGALLILGVINLN